MNIEELHQLTGKLIAQKRGNSTVAIDFATFLESENGTILEVDNAKHLRIQGVDDSGPVGKRYPFLVLAGPHARADARVAPLE